MNLDFIKKFRGMLLAGIVLIVAAVIFLLLGGRSNIPVTNQSPAPFSIIPPNITPTITPPIYNSAQVELKKEAIPNLPIYIKDFKTSAGLTTTINVYTLEKDPEAAIYLEVYGVDYQNRFGDTKKNPDALAYKESYDKAISEMKAKGIDPDKVDLVLGSKVLIRETAAYWLSQLR